MTTPNVFKEKLDTLNIRWTNAKNNYKASYSDAQLGLDTAKNVRARDAAIKTYSDILQLEAKMIGTMSAANSYLSNKDNQIKYVKTKYNDSKIQLGTKLGANNASIPFKIDKYNENSESYIISSYYFISLLTMSFFIYKQLKQ